MSKELIQILAAGMAGVSFSVIFRIRLKYLPVVFIGSALGWFVYLFSDRIFDSRTTLMIAASMAVTIFSEIAARIVRMPVSVIYAPAIIPLVPGSHLYYCIRAFVSEQQNDFIRFGKLLFADTLGIVLGSIIVLTFVSAVTAKKRKTT